MLQNAYFLAKIGADTAENEQHFAEICQKLATTLRVRGDRAHAGSGSRDRANGAPARVCWTWAALIAPVDPWGGGGSISAYQPTVSPKFQEIRFKKNSKNVNFVQNSKIWNVSRNSGNFSFKSMRIWLKRCKLLQNVQQNQRNIWRKFAEMLRSERCKKHVNLVDLVKSFPTNIFLQNLASIQKRRSPIKFKHV